MTPRHRFINMQLTNPNYAVLPEASQALSLPVITQSDASRNENAEELSVKKEGCKSKKRKSKGVVTTPKVF
ncbi:hypothetical protein MtrunA17_Chr2g0296951 [Medicago truncatula]|uniref:Uncharacterized protein n=1 Tax=Medicago truncatula TaxID=3880 RepID=A0A396JA52_MEDTR|nr:hypothetical protein MtrunA17_Chr2g0296951 [Medicago truncatula]